MPLVLVIATSRKTRGGITSVIKAHEKGIQWRKYHCIWIQTHRDSNAFVKVLYFITAFIEYLVLLPFCDIVHFHFSNWTTAKRKKLMMPFALILRKKTIVHFHTFSIERTINGPYRFRYEYLFGKSNLIIVLSEFWKTTLIEEMGIPEEKIRILYNPCPSLADNGEYKKDRESVPKTILYAGTVNHRKGYDDLIRAFAKIAHLHKDWRIVFAGNGEIEEAKFLANKLEIMSQTLFLGWVSGDEKDKAFRESSIFCLPSYAEGFPMAVLDAWAYGLPVITTPVGGIPDVAIDGKNMLLFNPGDIDSLAKQIELMINNESLRMAIAEESLILSQTVFNVDTINGQLGEIYKELLI